MQTLQDRLHGYILEKFPMAKKQVLGTEDDLLNGGVIDSLGILEVVSFIEQQFAITVEDEDLLPENFQSIDHMVAFVQKKRGLESGS